VKFFKSDNTDLKKSSKIFFPFPNGIAGGERVKKNDKIKIKTGQNQFLKNLKNR